MAIKLENLATRLESFATKQDLEKVATKLENLENRLENCATKQDFENLETRLESFATKQDLNELRGEVRHDLDELRGEVRVAIAEVKRDTVALKDRLNLFIGGIFLVLGWIVFMLMRMG